MRTNITKIGNSKGLIIPAHVLKQCGFKDEVHLEIKNDALVISKARKPRSGWAEAIEREGDASNLLIPDISNTFDDEDWQW